MEDRGRRLYLVYNASKEFQKKRILFELKKHLEIYAPCTDNI